jgi:hypothetical protein
MNQASNWLFFFWRGCGHCPLMSIYLLDGEVIAELMVSYLTGMYVVEAMQGTVKTLTRYATTTSAGNAQNKSLDRDNCKDNAIGKAL